MKVLVVLTSHDQLGDTGRKSGFWLEELAAPYYVFMEAGYEITLDSPKGGEPPLDPKSKEHDFQTDDTRRFEADAEANEALANTIKLAAISADDFDAVFYPGGHGPLWDLAESKESSNLIESFIAANKLTAPVCHASGVLQHVKTAEGRPLVKGKKVTGFTQYRGSRRRLDEGRAVPRRGRSESQGRRLFARPGMGLVQRAGRLAHHRPEPGFIDGGRRASGRTAQGVHMTACVDFVRETVTDPQSLQPRHHRLAAAATRGRGLVKEGEPA